MPTSPAAAGIRTRRWSWASKELTRRSSNCWARALAAAGNWTASAIGSPRRPSPAWALPASAWRARWQSPSRTPAPRPPSPRRTIPSTSPATPPSAPTRRRRSIPPPAVRRTRCWATLPRCAPSTTPAPPWAWARPSRSTCSPRTCAPRSARAATSPPPR